MVVVFYTPSSSVWKCLFHIPGWIYQVTVQASFFVVSGFWQLRVCQDPFQCRYFLIHLMYRSHSLVSGFLSEGCSVCRLGVSTRGGEFRPSVSPFWTRIQKGVSESWKLSTITSYLRKLFTLGKREDNSSIYFFIFFSFGFHTQNLVL